MAFPIAMIPLALSAIRGLLKFRGQLDSIFLAKEASAGLPFLLPPAPDSIAEHIDGMKAFFATEEGESILEFTGQTAQFASLSTIGPAEEKELIRIYLEVKGLELKKVGPEWSDLAVTPSLSQDAQLAYFMVSSDRLSRNPAVTRVILASAETLLEFAGDNAAFFISNPKTASIVGSVLKEFAGDSDLDDMSAKMIVRRLLGSAVVAALDHRGDLPDHPALNLLYGALAEVRRQHGATGANFVNSIITKEGFQQVVQNYLVMAADDQRFLSALGKIATGRDGDDPLAGLAKNSFAALLNALGGDLENILNDPRALSGVLEAALGAAARSAGPVLEKELAGQPLLVAVLKSVAEEVDEKTAQDALLGSVVAGELWGSLFSASLSAVAANAAAIQSSADVKPIVADLIAGVADVLSKQDIKEMVEDRGTDAFRLLAARSLEILAKEPEFLVGQHAFARKVLGSVLEATAPLLRDGLQVDDLLVVVDEAVSAAAGNLALVEMDDSLRAVLSSLGTALSQQGTRELLNARSRRDALLAGLRAVAANPVVWQAWSKPGQADLVKPLVEGLLAGLASDVELTKLVSGPVMVEAFRKSLLALGRLGAGWVTAETTEAQVEGLLTASLARAKGVVGKAVDGENLPDYLERVLVEFLKAPFDPLASDGSAKVKKITDKVVKQLKAA